MTSRLQYGSTKKPNSSTATGATRRWRAACRVGARPAAISPRASAATLPRSRRPISRLETVVRGHGPGGVLRERNRDAVARPVGCAAALHPHHEAAADVDPKVRDRTEKGALGDDAAKAVQPPGRFGRTRRITVEVDVLGPDAHDRPRARRQAGDAPAAQGTGGRLDDERLSRT